VAKGGNVKHLRWIAVVAAAALATAITGGTAAGQGGGGGGGGGGALTATDVGISPTEIRIGVIADTGSQIAPGLFQGSVDGVQAWAKYMNEKEGGLAGRKIVVDTYDSALDPNKARNAVIEACSKDFALVGTSALFLNNVDDLVACKDGTGTATGLPDFPFTQTETNHQCSTVSYAINPPAIDCNTRTQHPQTYRGGMGATNYFVKKFGKNALHGVFVYPSDLKSAKDAQVPPFTAEQQAGIKQDATFDVSARAPQSAYTPIVQAIKDNQSTYARHGGNDAQNIALMKEAKIQGVNTVKVWECSLQCYDKDILATPEAEGLYVWTTFLPFDETKSNKMLANLIKYIGTDKADGFSTQAWAAGILLRDMVNAVVEDGGNNALTRAALLKAAPNMTDFDADGMVGERNIGSRIGTSCYVLNQVKSAKFVRVFPKQKGTFECDPKGQYSLKLDLIN
jgi:ABC-type branched-subunit amino acid transport system substrate-binding protein